MSSSSSSSRASSSSSSSSSWFLVLVVLAQALLTITVVQAEFEVAIFMTDEMKGDANLYERELHEFKTTFSMINLNRSSEDFLGPGYIITMKDKIPWRAAYASLALGFYPILYRPVDAQTFKSTKLLYKACLPEVLREKHLFERLKNESHIRLRLAEMSLLCSHRRIMDTETTDKKWKSDWSAIFEDDAALHPHLQGDAATLVGDAITVAENSPNNIGFIYLGAKAGGENFDQFLNGCKSWDVTEPFIADGRITSRDILADCAGHGTHGYMFKRSLSKSFTDNVFSEYNLREGLFQIDQLYHKIFSNMYGPWHRYGKLVNPKDGERIKHNYFIGTHLVSPEQHKVRGGQVHR